MAIKSYPNIGEAYSDVTYSLGFALTQWQAVELKLYQLFVFLCGDSDRKAINVVFHEMPLEVRLRALTELVAMRAPSQAEAWAEVVKKVHKQRRMRDKLAHWTVVGDQHKDGGFTAWLSPPTTSEQARVVYENNHSAMGAQDLLDKSREFQIAAHAVHEFMMAFPELV